MILVIVGVILLVLKLAGMGPVADWPWWAVAAPFAGAVVWWVVADATGLTQRFAISRYETRRAERRRKAMELLGLVVPGRRPRRLAEDSAAPATAAPTTVASIVSLPPPPPAPKAPERDFGDTVPSMLDVPEDLGSRMPDSRRRG